MTYILELLSGEAYNAVTLWQNQVRTLATLKRYIFEVSKESLPWELKSTIQVFHKLDKIGNTGIRGFPMW